LEGGCGQTAESWQDGSGAVATIAREESIDQSIIKEGFHSINQKRLFVRGRKREEDGNRKKLFLKQEIKVVKKEKKLLSSLFH